MSIVFIITLSSCDKHVPSSSSENDKNATVPSVLHAAKTFFFSLHDKSNMLSLNSSYITHNGRWCAVNQTDNDLSRDPIARQQYFFAGSCLLRIDGWKRYNRLFNR